VVAVRSLQYEELMPESQDLCMKRGSIPGSFRIEWNSEKDDREHGIRKL